MHPKTTGNGKTSLSWPANPLRHSPRPDAQVHHTAGSAAPPVRASSNRPLAGPRAQDREKEREREISSGQDGRALQDKRGEIVERKSQLPTPARHTTHEPTHEARVLSAFCRAGLRPLLRPVFASASLRASARSLSKGACPLTLPPPRAVRGRGEVSFGSGPRNYPPKSGPHLFSPLNPGSDRTSHTPSAGK